MNRSYLEFQQFYETIIHSNPQTIIPALPLAQTSAPTDEEDDRLVKIMLQRWITRVCEDPILVHDEDLRSFIENDFGYQPTPRPRRKTSSGFGLMRRGVPDEDEELQRARFELTKLEGQFFDTAKAVDKLAVARKCKCRHHVDEVFRPNYAIIALAGVHIEMGNKLINVATTEAHPPLGNAFRKIGRTWHSVADLDHAQAISECVVLGDSLGYQGMNARSARETLLMRTGVLEEYQAAVKTTISKRRQIERLKASSNIRPDRVDEALEDMEEVKTGSLFTLRSHSQQTQANKYEQTLAKRAEGISQNLHRALQTHNRYANDDITTALIEHARSSIMYERQLLRELEALRVDVSNAANKVVPTTSGAPKPTVIPPLEEFNVHPVPRPAPSAPVSNGFQQPPPHLQSPPHTSYNTGPSLQRPNQGYPQQGPPSRNQFPQGSLSSQPQIQRQEPLSASTHPFAAHSNSFSTTPTHSQARFAAPPQSPGAGPSSPTPSQITFARPSLDEPPLGGRFVDGTKSMFVSPTKSSHPSPVPASASSTFASGPLQRPPVDSPLHADPLNGGVISPLHDGPPRMNGQALQSNGFDPLGHIKPQQMSSSVRVAPTRPRLDAREAASKLANMF